MLVTVYSESKLFKYYCQCHIIGKVCNDVWSLWSMCAGIQIIVFFFILVVLFYAFELINVLN